MGSDTKTVGGDIKYSENKIGEYRLGDLPLIVGEAGSARHCKDVISWMGLDNLNERLGRDQTFNAFLSESIEVYMPRFIRDYVTKYGQEADVEMLIGCIDEEHKPRLIQLYSDGDYDHMESYAAVGSGHIFGEVLLRKLFSPEITTEQAEKLIAYLIWEIQEVDDHSGEDMQILSIKCTGETHKVTQVDIDTYKNLPKIIYQSYQALRGEIEQTDLESIREIVRQLHNLTSRDKAKLTGGDTNGKTNEGTTKRVK